MTISNGYCTLPDLKGHVMANGGGSFTVEDDANMEIAIEAVSRLIDSLHETNYYGSTETRYFSAWWDDLLGVDDLISVTTLKTDAAADGVYETTWATTDYSLRPKNARVKTAAGDKEPYREIMAIASNTFPRGIRDGVEIVGVWGYTTAAPAVIKQATLLAAHRIYKRKDSIFGISGAPQLGTNIIQAQIQQDNDLVVLLQGVNLRQKVGRFF